MEVAKTLLRNRAVLRCHCERLLRGIRQTTSSSICSNSELELKTSTTCIRHSDSHHHVTRSSSCDSKLTPNRSFTRSCIRPVMSSTLGGPATCGVVFYVRHPPLPRPPCPTHRAYVRVCLRLSQFLLLLFASVVARGIHNQLACKRNKDKPLTCGCVFRPHVKNSCDEPFVC